MMRLVCALSTFRGVLARLVRGEQPVFVRLGHGERCDGSAWLCAFEHEGASSRKDRGAVVAFRLSSGDGSVVEEISSREVARVVISQAAGGVEARGHVRFLDGWASLTELVLIGPGMQRIVLHVGEGSNDERPDCRVNWRLRWARTLRATGVPAWKRTTRLHVGVVGCGRTGSQVAALLGRLGVRTLTLVDPDSIEMHNLGEMLVPDTACGSPKARAVGAGLAMSLSSLELDVRAHHAAVGDAESLEALRACDVIFSCVDDDRARLTLAVAATRRLQVHVDVGTGAAFGGAGMGADIRLFVPGERCILCLGGLRDLEGAIGSLAGRSHGRATSSRAPRPAGAGSLASLNSIAAGIAVHLLQAFVGEQLPESTWVGVDANTGIVSSRAIESARPEATDCLCAMAGRGEASDGGWIGGPQDR